jgi:hypothetical protein
LREILKYILTSSSWSEGERHTDCPCPAEVERDIILTILLLLMGSPNAVPIRRNLRLEECGDDQCRK